MTTRAFKFPITQSYVRCATALLLMLATAVSALPSMNADGRAFVIYPEEYRTWFHVKSALVSADYPDFEHSGGFRHIYANPQAVEPLLPVHVGPETRDLVFSRVRQ